MKAYLEGYIAPVIENMAPFVDVAGGRHEIRHCSHVSLASIHMMREQFSYTTFIIEQKESYKIL